MTHIAGCRRRSDLLCLCVDCLLVFIIGTGHADLLEHDLGLACSERRTLQLQWMQQNPNACAGIRTSGTNFDQYHMKKSILHLEPFTLS